jgi:hypothetical protein
VQPVVRGDRFALSVWFTAAVLSHLNHSLLIHVSHATCHIKTVTRCAQGAAEIVSRSLFGSRLRSGSQGRRCHLGCSWQQWRTDAETSACACVAFWRGGWRRGATGDRMVAVAGPLLTRCHTRTIYKNSTIPTHCLCCAQRCRAQRVHSRAHLSVARTDGAESR